VSNSIRRSTVGFVVMELLLLSLLGVFWWNAQRFQTDSEVRMRFWQYGGQLQIPDELSAEERIRKVLKSTIVWQRVKLRLSWELSEADYKDAVDLESRRHDWSPAAGVSMILTAIGPSPEQAKELCNIASEEFCGRCMELANELEAVFWDLQLAKVAGPLQKWKYDHKAMDEASLKERAERLRRRLKLSIAAQQMELREAKAGDTPRSEQTKKLLDRAREIDEALDNLWLQGISNETVTDLKEARRAQKERIKDSLRNDKQAALNGLEDALDELQGLEAEVDPKAVEKAIRELEGLQQGFQALVAAMDLSMKEMSMYCYPYRKPYITVRLAATLEQLWPALFCLLLLGTAAIGHRRYSVSQLPVAETGQRRAQ
jgi:hypothetical protein